MAQIDKTKFRGHNLLKNAMLISVIVIELFLGVIIDIVVNNPYVGIIIFMVFIIYCLMFYALDKTFSERVSKEKGGKKRPKGRYNLGRGRTGDYAWVITNIYTIEDASQYLRKNVGEAELEMIKEEIHVKKILGLTDESGEVINPPLLSLQEVKDLEHYASVEPLEEGQQYQKDFKEQYISEKMLQRFYELDTGENAIIFNDSKKQEEPTEAYELWKDEQTDMHQIIQSEVKKQLDNIESEKNEKNLEKFRVWETAKKIASYWSIRQIKAAIENDPEGASIHGYLQRFSDYKNLIKKEFVLDKAMEIAEATSRPELYGLVEHRNLNECVRNICDLDKPYAFDHEPDLTFEKVIWYSRSPLATALDWKEGIRQTIDDYPDIPMEVGYANINVLARIQHNLPLVHTAHAPGKDGYVEALEYDKEEIEKEVEDVRNEQIHELLNDNYEIKDKADFYEGEAERFRSIATKYKTKLEDFLDKDADAFIQEVKREIQEKEEPSLNKDKLKRIGFGLVIFVAIIVILIFIFGFGAGGGSIPGNATL